MLKAFPILDMKVGKYTRREPWLAPQDAFETLSDCHLKRGVLEKRQGYTEFAQMLAVATTTKAPTFQTNPIMAVANFFDGPTDNLIVFDQNRMNKYLTGASTGVTITAFADYSGTVAGTVKATAATHGFTTDDIVTHTGTTNYNGTFSVTRIDANNYYFTDTWVADDGTGSASQELFLDVTKNKIRYVGNATQNWTPSDGDVIEGVTSGATATVDTSGLILDAGTVAGLDARGTIVFKNGTVSGTFQDNEILRDDGNNSNIAGQSQGAASDDAFTGDNTNFFHVANWTLSGTSKAYICNNNDPIQKYDGTQLSRLTVDIGDDDDVNDITACYLIFVYKERLILFRTQEDGSDFFQRARWSTVKDPESWPTANFKDAPTSDAIVAGGFLGDDLFIWFENSTYRFAYTGDSEDPFEWERISTTDGAAAKNSIITIPLLGINTQIALGPTRVLATDGRTVVGIDEKIPDFALTFTQNSLPYSQSLLLEEERLAMITYADSNAIANADGNIYPNRALVLNYEDGSYATYGLPIHTLGKSRLENAVNWLQDTTWDNYTDPWNLFSAQAGFPTTLMGSQDGKVYQINTTGADSGSDIEFSAEGGQWNPFVKQGRKARLAYIDFLVDVDATATFDVNGFVNNDADSFQTKTVTCTAVNGSEEMAWHRVYQKAIASFHRIQITNNASSNRPRIHAIIPYMEPSGGRMI
jgi:hypothetical protein